MGVSDRATKLKSSLNGEHEERAGGGVDGRDSMAPELIEDEDLSVVGSSASARISDGQALKAVNGLKDGEGSRLAASMSSTSSIKR